MTLTSYLAASLSLPRAKPGPICPSAPAEMANAVSDLGGYVVYVVLALVGVTIAASVGLLLAGKASNSQMMTRSGAGGLLIVVVGAILWVTIPGIADGIIGTGCVG